MRTLIQRMGALHNILISINPELKVFIMCDMEKTRIHFSFKVNNLLEVD